MHQHLAPLKEVQMDPRKEEEVGRNQRVLPEGRLRNLGEQKEAARERRQIQRS